MREKSFILICRRLQKHFKHFRSDRAAQCSHLDAGDAQYGARLVREPRDPDLQRREGHKPGASVIHVHEIPELLLLLLLLLPPPRGGVLEPRFVEQKLLRT